jgi:ferredoxin
VSRQKLVDVHVHPERCMGSGMCRGIAPAVFGLGPDGWVTLLDARPIGGNADAARDAAESCPTGSIEIGGDEGNEVNRPCAG